MSASQVLSNLYSRLAALAGAGVLVARNPTVALAVPAAGAVVLLDGTTTAERSLGGQHLSDRIARLELFSVHGGQTLAALEAVLTAALQGDPTLSGTVEHLFLSAPAISIVDSEGLPITVATYSLSLTFS